ncbi:MAG: GNAT family N-acetyltransferase [Bryobacteraceae bacterium]|nr:GNAT family N-acetyltransferase [Bryobacteraceae bacterium]
MAEGQESRRIEIRKLSGLDELNEAVRLQKEIWGFADIELLPLRLFVVAQKVGGQTLGAFDGGRMVGFLLAVPGLKQGMPYLHSHMMGVLPEYRNLGVGRRLKLAQREEALSRGIRLIEWTFDPLELKNAFFNIERLGAIVRRYVLNQYGTTSSPLHGGLPTDRCVAEWHLDSPRVLAVLEGREPERGPVLERIAIPAGIAEIRASDPAKAREIQAAASRKFVEYFDRGLAVIGFERSPEAGVYLFGKWPSA